MTSLDNWPQNKLGCLSEANKLQSSKVTTSTNATFLDQMSKIIDVSRFSDFSKLLRVAGFVFKAIHKFKGITEEDPFLTGKLHLLIEMQKRSIFSQAFIS